jgi:hypothetical protein
MPKCILKENIKMDLYEVGYEGMDWIHLVRDSDQWQTIILMQ